MLSFDLLAMLSSSSVMILLPFLSCFLFPLLRTKSSSFSIKGNRCVFDLIFPCVFIISLMRDCNRQFELQPVQSTAWVDSLNIKHKL